jgi:hypothetical protein
MQISRRVFKTRPFARWQRKTQLTDDILCRAILEMEQGLIDADLGGGLFKKRIALPGRGKSGGTRTMIASNRSDRWIFVYGFEKNERENINTIELKALRSYAQIVLSLAAIQFVEFVKHESFQEICDE